jgi:predicted PilT family ATPase
MNLQLIKTKVEEQRYPGGIKGLAESVGMTEQNLHRCVRENKIQAQDLEKISTQLKVSIIEFFDEKISSIHTEGDYSPASEKGNITQTFGDAILQEKVKYLEAIIQEKDERIKELKERIADLKA